MAASIIMKSVSGMAKNSGGGMAASISNSISGVKSAWRISSEKSSVISGIGSGSSISGMAASAAAAA